MVFPCFQVFNLFYYGYAFTLAGCPQPPAQPPNPHPKLGSEAVPPPSSRSFIQKRSCSNPVILLGKGIAFVRRPFHHRGANPLHDGFKANIKPLFFSVVAESCCYSGGYGEPYDGSCDVSLAARAQVYLIWKNRRPQHFGSVS